MRPSRILPLIAYLTIPLLAQSAEPHSPNLITLNVVALDSHDAPVTDLSASDFHLTDRGATQKIVVFRRNEPTALKSEAPLAPHQFSNRRGPALSQVTVILFDVLNTPMPEQGYARNQLVKSLPKLESGEFLYMYLLTPGGLLAVRGLPDGQSDTPGPDWIKQPDKILDAALQGSLRMNLGMYPEDRVKSTFLSLDALAGRLAAVTGRKNVVWITRGIPIEIGPNRTVTGDVLDYEPLIRQFSSTLQQANVALYPVDDRMASMDRSASPPDGLTPPQFGRAGANAASTDPTSRQGGLGSMDTLQQFADLTGGRTNFSNDIGAAVRQALTDARDSYLVGYDPPENNWDGKFHKIQLKCTRRGVRLQARTGYFAVPPASLLDGQEQAALDAASLSPFDAAEIGLRVAISPSPATPHGTHFEIQPQLGDLTLTPDQKGSTGELSLTLFEYHSGSRMTESTPFRFKISLTPDQLAQAQKIGVKFQHDWPVDDDVSRVRLVLFDYGSKSTGSITIPIAASDRRSP